MRMSQPKQTAKARHKRTPKTDDTGNTVMKALLSFSLCLLLCLETAQPAYAVIPQLLGPLTALLSIVPQILAFVGVALLTALVFARDTTKMLLYRLRDAAASHKPIAATFGLLLLLGIGWATFTLTRGGVEPTARSTDTEHAETTGQTTATPIAWSTFRGGKNRTGHLDTLPGPTHGTPAWAFKEEEAMAVDFSSSPAIVGNRLYIGSSHGSVFSLGGATYCIDIDTQQVLWRYASPIPIFSSPAVAGGRVYIGEGYHHDDNCHLRCLDAKTGEQIWAFRTTSHVESTPFISQGKLYFTAGADGVYCIDALEGQLIWHYPDIHADMAPVVHNGMAYFGTGYDGYRIYAVDAQTGREIWSREMPYPVWGSPTALENTVFFGLGRGDFVKSHPIPAGKVIALDAETGKTRWEFEPGDVVMTAIALYERHIFFGARDGFVYSLNVEDGGLNWKTDLGAPVVSSPAVTPATVYAATKNGHLYALSTEDGTLDWTFDAAVFSRGIEFYSSPAVANGALYIGTSDRYILSFKDGDTHQTVDNR